MSQKALPSADEDPHASAAADGAGLPPGVEIKPDDCRFGRIRGDHPGAPGRGAAVQTEVGVDVSG